MSFIPGTLTLKDGPQLSPFSRLRVTGATTLFDSQQEYGLDTLRVWDCTANGTLPGSRGSNGSVTDGAGNSVGPRNANTGFVPITVSATNGHYAILQSGQYTRYVPGFGHLIFVTGVFATAINHTASMVLRTSTSGTPSDTKTVAQADWSEDPFDGTGPSGVDLDFTKIQILAIDAQMLYAGRVRTYFDVDGILWPAHFWRIANNQSVPTMQTFNLPVRLEAQTVTTTVEARVGYFDNANGVFLKTVSAGAGGTIQFECCAVQADGPGELRGFPMCVGTSPTVRVGVTTRRPILSIRPAATFNSKTNRGHIELAEFILSAKTNNAMYEIVIGGTLSGGAGVWTAVNTDSITEYNTDHTGISGGIPIRCGRVISGSGSSVQQTSGTTDPRGPLTLRQINALTAYQPAISVVATSETGTADLTADLHWHEQVV